jgi:hypothetical protein
MKIFVKAKPNSKKEFVEKISETNLIVAVKEPPVKGRASFAIQKALAEYFKVSASQVVLVSGFSSKNKIFEIKIPTTFQHSQE